MVSYWQALTEIGFAIQDRASDLSRQISLLQLELLSKLTQRGFFAI